MANLEDSIRSAVPGGNIGKPLMIAFIALLASVALFRGSSTDATANAGPQPKSDEGSGGLLGGLGGLLQRLQKGGLGDVASSWVGNGQNQPMSPNKLGPALGSDIIKTLAQRSGFRKKS
jgi:uncharacterized protein YidB (DUF937 family)